VVLLFYWEWDSNPRRGFGVAGEVQSNSSCEARERQTFSGTAGSGRKSADAEYPSLSAKIKASPFGGAFVLLGMGFKPCLPFAKKPA